MVLANSPRALDQAAPAHVVTPMPAGCVQRHGEEERDGAVAAGRVSYAAFDSKMIPGRAEPGLQLQTEFLAGAIGERKDI